MNYRLATIDDDFAIEALYDLSFAPGRQALSSYQLRTGVSPIDELSFVVEDFEAIVGAIRYWPILIGSAQGLLLGPVAVHPTVQGMGVATQLIILSLEKAKALGWKIVILIGDEPYYSRFGFSSISTNALKFPPPTNPDRFLGLSLEDGALEGLSGYVTKLI